MATREPIVETALTSLVETFNQLGKSPPIVMLLDNSGKMHVVGPLDESENIGTQIKNIIVDYLRYMASPLTHVIVCTEAVECNAANLDAQTIRDLWSGKIRPEDVAAEKRDVMVALVQYKDGSVETLAYPVDRSGEKAVLGTPRCQMRKPGESSNLVHTFDLAREWDVDLSDLTYSNRS